ncbi:MAG: phosphoribosylamine--glycine ligase [Lachnospiraceae bacterium]|nr:phosphoribosylamine--glycine ligase [Lachnospiraceae bacterium]
MKIMVIGGGGREHAIIRKLKENPLTQTIYALPGNGGIARDAECVAISATDIPAQVDFAVKNGIDFAVVAPDDPLVLGAVDALEEAGIPCFGPDKKAAIIEGSKAFAKDLMKKYGIPTAAYETFTKLQEALAYVEKAPLPLVVKADGLALGKGVVIAHSRQEAEEAVRDTMESKKFGKSGETLVIEEFLTGPEVTVLALTDGKTIAPLKASTDHKTAWDGDQGPNTGGMGTIAPTPYYTKEVAARCMEEIFLPTIRAMGKEGRPFKGCLYFGLMITPEGPKVIEYNCRFGDPETQVVLPLLKSDLLSLMLAVRAGKLEEQLPLAMHEGAAACVIMASEGYPGAYKKGFPIMIPEDLLPQVYVAGAAEKDGELVTAGGRVLGVCGRGRNLQAALDEAYAAVEQIKFEKAYYRKDIGHRALKKDM